MISNEPVITVSPEETTRYRLKVQTAKGLVDYTDIVVYVMDILECQFDYTTGNIVSQYGTVLTKNQALSRYWNANGQAVVTINDFTQANPKITCTQKGGLVFSSRCFVPSGSNTLIAGIWLDDVKSIELYNTKAVIDGTEYPFSNPSQYYAFEISVVYLPETEKFRFSLTVTDTFSQTQVFEGSKDVTFGVFDSEISLYLIGSTTAKAGFYYGSNGIPVAFIRRSALTVPVGGKVLLDASDSYDPDGDAVSYNWLSKPFDGSRFKKLYKNSESITEKVNGSTFYRVQVSDFENTVQKDVIVTNYTVSQVDPNAYELKAVLDDVSDLFSYSWSASDDSLSATTQTVVVQPLGSVVYRCLVTEISSGETTEIEIPLSGDLRIIHARNTLTGEYQEIKVYPDTRMLSKFIECKVQGYPGFIAVGDLDDPLKSMLKCRINGEDYAILLYVKTV